MPLGGEGIQTALSHWIPWVEGFEFYGSGVMECDNETVGMVSHSLKGSNVCRAIERCPPPQVQVKTDLVEHPRSLRCNKAVYSAIDSAEGPEGL